MKLVRSMAEIVAAEVIQDFAIIMMVAAVIALISYRLKQPLVIGYIGASVIIGHILHHLALYSTLKF